jgi:hypothetical protein
LLNLIAAPTANAQRRGRGGMRPGELTGTRLLTLSVVQTELKLSTEQKAGVKKINDELTDARHKLFGEVAKESRERGKRVAELNRATDAKVSELLDEAQEKRLGELLLQANGAGELLNEGIQKALAITPEQQKSLSEIRRKNEQARREAFKNFNGDREAKFVELQREGDKKLLEVLTADQRAQFEKMQGKQIAIDLSKS